MAIKTRIDLGNGECKVQITQDGEKEFSFPSAIKRLSESEWKSATLTGKREGYIGVNGIPYVVGDMALRHGIKERPRGASRYTEHYFGVALCFALVTGLKRSSSDVIVYASHAPRDVQYVPNIKAAAKNGGALWNVEYMGNVFEYGINEVHTLDEPICGFNYAVLEDTGTPKKNNPIKNLTVVVMDIGSYTTDALAVDPGGRIDITTLTSKIIGISDVMKNFEEGLRANNKTAFQKTGDIHPRRLRQAFETGIFKGGGYELPCDAEAREASSLFLNEVDVMFESMGGLTNYDGILGTGGGAKLLHGKLKEQYPNMPFYLAGGDKDENAHMWNVRGMRCTYNLIETVQKRAKKGK